MFVISIHWLCILAKLSLPFVESKEIYSLYFQYIDFFFYEMQGEIEVRFSYNSEMTFHLRYLGIDQSLFTFLSQAETDALMH